MIRLALLILILILDLGVIANPTIAADFVGAPSGVTNLTNPEIYISGTDLVSYKYKLGFNEFSSEIPIETPIILKADVLIDNRTFVAGSKELYNFINARTDINNNTVFLDSIGLDNIASDLQLVYLINKHRIFIDYANVLNLEGTEVDTLNVTLKHKTTTESLLSEIASIEVTGGRLISIDDGMIKKFMLSVPLNVQAVKLIPIVNNQQTSILVNDSPVISGQSIEISDLSQGELIYLQSIAEDGVILNYEIEVNFDSSLDTQTIFKNYYFKTNDPLSAYFSVLNSGVLLNTFKMNLNGKIFSNDQDVLNEALNMPPIYPDEPIHAKVWRFVRDNKYHGYAVTSTPGGQWIHSPSLFFNSLGFGLCDNVASIYYQIMAKLGYQARVWGLDGHVVPEVLINNRWEMWDPDLEVYYYNEQGLVAGVDDLAANPLLITDPISPVLASGSFPYSSSVAEIYTTIDNNQTSAGYTVNPVTNYNFKIDIPPGGNFEFPDIYDSPLKTTGGQTETEYANARLIVPRGWSGTVGIPLVIHSIGYSNNPTISVYAKNSSGEWETQPSIANWTLDFIPPVTQASQPSGYFNPDEPLTLSVSKPATIYFTTDGADPTINSQIYSVPIPMNDVSVVKFFAIDTIGNQESNKTYAAPVSSIDLNVERISDTLFSFIAQATGTSGIYEFLFAMGNPESIWTVQQNYSLSNNWKWDATGLATGTYDFQVWVRNVGSTDIYQRIGYYSYTISPPISAVTLTTSVPSPQTLGTKVDFVAAASGGSGSYEYQFYILNPQGTWTMIKPYSSSSIWTWDTANVASGTYSIQVWARNAGSSSTSYEAWKGLKYTISLPVSAVVMTTSVPSPQTLGNKVVFSSTASGGSGSYEYQYFIQDPQGIWTISKPYSSSNSWTWDTVNAVTGTYSIQVWARTDGSSSTSYEAWQGTNFTINPPVSAVTLTTTVPSPQTVGTKVDFTASASGGSGSYEYQYFIQNPLGIWTNSKPYSSSNTWTWDTVNAVTGTYSIQVWARTTGSSSTSYEAWKGIKYTLNPPVSTVTLATSVPSPQTVGIKVDFVATASGGSASYEYQYYLQDLLGTWTMVKPYSSSSTWTWDTVNIATGIYSIQVWVRTAGSNIPGYEAWKGTRYAISP